MRRHDAVTRAHVMSMVTRFTPRQGYALGFLVCLALLGFGLYLQYFEEQNPCPLCIVQRVAFIALGIVFLIAAVHGPGRAGVIAYSCTLFVLAGIGAAVAGRHVWLQNLPRNQIPECGPGLQYMLERFPLGTVLEKVLKGSGECAEVGWTFLGLSIAGWSLVWFVALGAGAVAIALMLARRAAG
jgi:disulfide bond formation protein DsbB